MFWLLPSHARELKEPAYDSKSHEAGEEAEEGSFGSDLVLPQPATNSVPTSAGSEAERCDQDKYYQQRNSKWMIAPALAKHSAQRTAHTSRQTTADARHASASFERANGYACTMRRIEHRQQQSDPSCDNGHFISPEPRGIGFCEQRPHFKNRMMLFRMQATP